MSFGFVLIDFDARVAREIRPSIIQNVPPPYVQLGKTGPGRAARGAARAAFRGEIRVEPGRREGQTDKGEGGSGKGGWAWATGRPLELNKF